MPAKSAKKLDKADKAAAKAAKAAPPKPEAPRTLHNLPAEADAAAVDGGEFGNIMAALERGDHDQAEELMGQLSEDQFDRFSRALG